MSFKWIFAGLFVFSGWAQANEAECISQADDLQTKIECLENVASVEKQEGGLPGQPARYNIKYTQPANHEDPSAGTFEQYLVLLHRSEDEPMVLQTSGYMIYSVAETAMTRMFQTNQLQIEHRFFANSTPEGSDWSLLNIKQSADDFHRITQDFKKIYPKNWVNTGGSKGGMTSTYHKYFYPDDLNGTLADVAPLSFSRTDQRYNTFIRNVGGEKYAECRKNLADFQITMLQNREKFADFIRGDFTQVGGAEVVYEHAVIEIPFYFWQYGNPDDPSRGCPSVPVNSDVGTLFRFLNTHANIQFYADRSIQRFLPYFYQAATELGGPDNITDHLEEYRNHEFDLTQYTPRDIPLPYDNSSMRAVSNWVKTEAKDILFIYGTYDPWTAAEYDIGENTNVFKYYVPGGNHGATFVKLPEDTKKLAIAHLSEWLGKDPVNTEPFGLFGEEKSLEELEFEARMAGELK